MGRTVLDQRNQQTGSNATSPVMLSPPIFYTSTEEEEEDGSWESELNNSVARELKSFPNQVAGHCNKFGIVKFKEALLKPILNNVYFEREALFYEHLQGLGGSACECDPDMLIKRLVPKYFGRSEVQLNGTCVQCLVMEDLTRGMREPCIMDLKIGKRTWDPDASSEKIHCEDAKYYESKRQCGFCIPGFQVYDVKTGKLRKFDKGYGRQLNRNTIVDSLRMFLNGHDKTINRVLLVQILVDLWHIQRWARKQHRHRLYSSSILLIYDAKRLRQLQEKNPKSSKPVPPPPVQGTCGLRRTNSLYRPLSLAVLNDKCTKTGFSGQLNKDGPIFPGRLTRPKPKHSQTQDTSKSSAASLKRMHSFHNNYDDDLRSIRTDYASILEDLVADSHKEIWAGARMIDFAHAFPAESTSRPDNNYLSGIDNLVEIIESFLVENEDE